MIEFSPLAVILLILIGFAFGALLTGSDLPFHGQVKVKNALPPRTVSPSQVPSSRPPKGPSSGSQPSAKEVNLYVHVSGDADPEKVAEEVTRQLKNRNLS